MSAERYYTEPFRQLVGCKRLQEFTVLDATHITQEAAAVPAHLLLNKPKKKGKRRRGGAGSAVKTLSTRHRQVCIPPP